MLSSLRAKFIVITVLVMLASSATVAILGNIEHENLYRNSAINHLDALSSNLADQLIPLISENSDDAKVATELLALDRYEEVKYAYILDSQRQVLNNFANPTYVDLVEAGQRVDRQYINEAEGVRVVGGDLIALKLIGEPGYSFGYVLVVSDYAGPLQNSASNLFRNFLPTLLLIAVLAIWVSAWFYRRLLRHLNALSHFTRSIKKSDDYQMRFDVAGKDEVADLGHSINGMLETIDEQNQKSIRNTELLMEQRQSLQELANYDALTKLPNRKFFNDMLKSKLANARRARRNLAIMFLDLDNFKQVNDSLGHEVGDSLLVEVSDRIKEHLREGDILARIGGDEFLILIPEFSESFSLGMVADRLINALNTNIQIGDWDVHTGISIGIADAKSAGYQLHSLIRNADMAMYQAKENGRGTYAFFVQGLLEDSIRKINIANALNVAIKENQFEVFYQAKVDNTKQVCGFEALVRWKSNTYGYVSPAEFIPIAEQSGRITNISRWVISQVFDELGVIQSMSERPLTVSINLSTHDLRDKEFTQFIRDKVEEYEVDTSLIQFEVTESAYLDNFDQANEFLSVIHDLGCSVALDDFGTGYSSLSYLTRIRVDTIKIDREFIDNINESKQDTLIIETILDLAGNLGLSICAEGVETSEQSDFLLQKGCDQLQGFYYAKPTALGSLEKSIEHISSSTDSSSDSTSEQRPPELTIRNG